MSNFFDNIKHHLTVGSFFLKLSIQLQLEYPAFLIGWFFANGLQFLAGLMILKFLMDKFQFINGWSFGQIAFMYGIGAISHALAIIFFIQTWSIEYRVTEGRFDTMLLRPLSIYFQFATEYINLIGLTDLLPGMIIFIYGINAVGFQFTFGNFFAVLFIILGATFIRGAIYTFTGSIAFWTKRSYHLIPINNMIFEKTIMYPTTIFGNAVQWVLTFLFPLAFVAFYPASYLLNMDMGLNIPGPIPVWTFFIGIIMLFLSVLLFHLGLKKYDSAGS